MSDFGRVLKCILPPEEYQIFKKTGSFRGSDYGEKKEEDYEFNSRYNSLPLYVRAHGINLNIRISAETAMRIQETHDKSLINGLAQQLYREICKIDLNQGGN